MDFNSVYEARVMLTTPEFPHVTLVSPARAEAKCHMSRTAPDRTSGERDAIQPQARDQTESSFPNVTRTLNSGEAELS
jgi:hypothetical protein